MQIRRGRRILVMKDLVITPISIVFTRDHLIYQGLHRVLSESFLVEWYRDNLEPLGDHQKSHVDLIIMGPFLDQKDMEPIFSFCQTHYPKTPLFLVAKEGDQDTCRLGFAKGVTNILSTPLDENDIRLKVTMAMGLERAIRDKSLPPQELGHIYNLLKAHYYQIDDILLYIKEHELSVEDIREELLRKQTFGTCAFDHIPLKPLPKIG